MKTFYGKPVDSNPVNEFNSFILNGGFPRAIKFYSMESKRAYTKSVIDEIFQKDIRRRVHIGNRHAFESVRNYMINNFGATTSIRSLENALKQSGIQISRPTLARYIQVLIDARILYAVDRFDMKSKRPLNGDRKYYLADMSFYYAANTDNRVNYGPVLENILYIYVRGKNYSVSIGRIGNLECDFILRSPDMEYSYVQVAISIMSDKETEDREYRPLEKIRDNYKKYVATLDPMLQKRNGIEHINLIDFIKSGGDF